MTRGPLSDERVPRPRHRHDAAAPGRAARRGGGGGGLAAVARGPLRDRHDRHGLWAASEPRGGGGRYASRAEQRIKEREAHMDILLTRATGYIGRAVADALIAGGRRVVGLARNAEAVDRLREAWHRSRPRRPRRPRRLGLDLRALRRRGPPRLRMEGRHQFHHRGRAAGRRSHAAGAGRDRPPFYLPERHIRVGRHGRLHPGRGGRDRAASAR